MRDFEARVQAAYDRWAGEMPTDLDTRAFVQATRASALQSRSRWRPARRQRHALVFDVVPVRIVVAVAAISLLAVVGMSIVPRMGGVAGPASGPVVTPGPLGWRATGAMTGPRFDHSATVLHDGRVLVAGGRSLDGRESLSSAELYDPQSGSWSATGDMLSPGSGDAVLLDDGRVLLVREASAELYDPTTGSWAPAAPMTTRDHITYTVTRLVDGRVLLAGMGGAEVYDPESDSWTRTGDMLTPRYNHVATLLLDGRVLVAGGDEEPDSEIHTAELYDSATGSWSATGDVGVPRSHGGVLLPDGRVLDMGAPYGGPQLGDLYDPDTGQWSPVDIDIVLSERYLGDPVLLLDGTVLFIASRETVVYDTSDGSWARVASMVEARVSKTPTLLIDGRVLVSGGHEPGVNDPVVYSSAELYGPTGQ